MTEIKIQRGDRAGSGATSFCLSLGGAHGTGEWPRALRNLKEHMDTADGRVWNMHGIMATTEPARSD